MNIQAPVEANERVYPMPKVPAIAICLDGCEPEYLEVAIAKGLMPTLKRMRETGTRWLPPKTSCARFWGLG